MRRLWISRIRKGQVRGHAITLTMVLTIVLSLLTLAIAQPLDPEVQDALGRGRAAAEEARATYSTNTPDRPLWQEALREGNAALRLAPDNPEVVRFLAETYSAVRWHVRSWASWLRYHDLSNRLDADAQTQLAEAGGALGFTRYQAGDLSGALEYYQTVYDLAPDDPRALTWLGRIHFEQGDPEAALPYWREVVRRNPADQGAAYYLERAENQLEVGVEASNAFYTGLESYNIGELQAALDAFVRATTRNDSYTEAFAWAGRVSLELGRPEDATRYWQRVAELDPDDTRPGYFIDLAAQQAQWGLEAVSAFQEGVNAYELEDLEGAAAAFRRAAEANPRFREAAVRTARAYQELNQPERAVAFWEQALSLDPGDTQAEYFLGLARDQITFGDEAARAFREGLDSYQIADYSDAEASFQAAVEANPDYAEAWSWLGRIYLDQADYQGATDAYERAAVLEPDNDAYRFFADEAKRLRDTLGDPEDPGETSGAADNEEAP